MMMTIFWKFIIGLAVMGIGSCSDPVIDDPPMEPESTFDLQWSSLLNGDEGVISLADGLLHQGMYIKAGSDGVPRLMAFDLDTGEKLWQRDYPEIGDDGIERLYVADGVLICRNSFTVFAVDVENQSVMWSRGFRELDYRLQNVSVSPSGHYYIEVVENFSPIGGGIAHLLRFDPHSGAMETIVSHPPDSIGTKGLSPPTFFGDDIVIYNVDRSHAAPPQDGAGQDLIAYDMFAKEELWRSRVRDVYAGNCCNPPAIYDDRIVITGSGWSIYGFDVETGEQLWRYDLPGFNSGGNFWITTNHLIHGDKLFVNELGEYVACLDPRTGEEIWLNKKGGANCSDNMVYYEQEDVLVLSAWGYGSVMILDGTTGETIHREHEYENAPYTDDPVYDPETDMFFTCTYYHAVAFKVKRPD